MTALLLYAWKSSDSNGHQMTLIPRALILDSHVAIWAIQDQSQLGNACLRLIDDPTITVFLSAASYWEILIKKASGKLDVVDNFADLIERAGYIELPVTFRHAEIAARLPLHHRDPFDRMLVAQAQAEGLGLVTDDAMISRYQVSVLPAR